MKTTKHIALALVLGLWTAEAMAWGQQGTAMVGELAQRQLAPEAAAEAGRLLGLIQQDKFAVVANWAGNLNNNPQTKELWEKTRNERLVIYQADDCQYQPARDCPDGVCSVAAIERNRALLGDPQAPDQTRLMAMLFLIHHVADAHSPLNNSFKDDKGGYDYPVRIGGKTHSLRRVWDDYLLASARLDVEAYADRLQQQLPTTAASSPAAWSEESCKVVRDGDIYPRAVSNRRLPSQPFNSDGFDSNARNLEYNRTGQEYSRGDRLRDEDTGNDSGDTIDTRYLQKFAPLAEQRVAQASVRLAALLDEALVSGRATTVAPAE